MAMTVTEHQMMETRLRVVSDLVAPVFHKMSSHSKESHAENFESAAAGFRRRYGKTDTKQVFIRFMDALIA